MSEVIAMAKGVSIGDKFCISRSKGRSAHSRDYTVVDIHTTTNSKGEVVKIEFKAVFSLMGQQVSEMVVAPTVLRNKISPTTATTAINATEQLDTSHRPEGES